MPRKPSYKPYSQLSMEGPPKTIMEKPGTEVVEDTIADPVTQGVTQSVRSVLKQIAADCLADAEYLEIRPNTDLQDAGALALRRISKIIDDILEKTQ